MELGLDLDALPEITLVGYRSLQRREKGKQPNYLIGAMDIAANALTLTGLLSPQRDPSLVRAIFKGPLHRRAGGG